MKLLNLNEKAPDVFYIFINNGSSIFNEINYHNYKLGAPLISGGFKNLMVMPEKTQDFIDGNIDYFPFVIHKQTFSSPTSHMLNVVNGYNVEYILEYNRNLKYKEYPSRFSCIFAFGDMKSCELASKYYGWDLSNVRKFKIKKLDSDLDKCVKIVKCNMEIVTRMWNCGISTFDVESIHRIADAYWNGIDKVATETVELGTGKKITTSARILYEYLIEGMLEEIKE